MNIFVQFLPTVCVGLVVLGNIQPKLSLLGSWFKLGLKSRVIR